MHIRLVDQDGEVLYEMSETEAYVLYSELKDLVKLRAWGIEESNTLMSQLGWWLNAKSAPQPE